LTGTAVWVPLPAVVTNALNLIPLADSAVHFFWSGEGKPRSCVGDFQRSLRRLFTLAGVPDVHLHRFRDRFAVELLLAGVPLGAGVDSAGSPECKDYREALFAMGGGSAGAA